MPEWRSKYQASSDTLLNLQETLSEIGSLRGEAPQHLPGGVSVAALPPPTPHQRGFLRGLRPPNPHYCYYLIKPNPRSTIHDNASRHAAEPKHRAHAADQQEQYARARKQRG